MHIMKCPICGKDVELQKKQVGVDEQGAPVFHQYAVCRDCKKQWDLDKQRARKAVPDTTANAEKAEALQAQPEKDPGEHKETAPDASPKAGAVKKAPAGSAKPEKKEPPAGSVKPEKKEPPAGSVKPEKKEPKKAAAAHSSSEGGSPRKTASGTVFAEGKVSRRPAPAEEETPGGSAHGKASAEGDNSGKTAQRKGGGEGRAPRKKVSDEASSERKAARKSADGAVPADARSPRRAVAGAPSQEKRIRKPDTQKPSGEKVRAAKPSSVKRPSAEASAEKAAERSPSGKPPVKKRPAGAPVNPAAEHPADGSPKRKAVRKSMAESEEQRYGNIPPEKVRVKKEHAVRKGYEDMLSTDPNYKPAKKKRPLAEEEVKPVKKEQPVPAKKRPATKASLEDEYEDEDEMDYDETEYVVGRFRVLRIIFGIISVLASGFFAYGGFFAGLENIASGSTVSTGTTFLIFAICMLVAGLMLLIMQNRNTILAFILPMVFYFGAAVFTFIKRADDKMFLYCAIGGAVFGLIFLVLGIVSRNSDGYEDSDDYDDPFEDEYE